MYKRGSDYFHDGNAVPKAFLVTKEVIFLEVAFRFLRSIIGNPLSTCSGQTTNVSPRTLCRVPAVAYPLQDMIFNDSYTRETKKQENITCNNDREYSFERHLSLSAPFEVDQRWWIASAAESFQFKGDFGNQKPSNKKYENKSVNCFESSFAKEGNLRNNSRCRFRLALNRSGMRRLFPLD